MNVLAREKRVHSSRVNQGLDHLAVDRVEVHPPAEIVQGKKGPGSGSRDNGLRRAGPDVLDGHKAETDRFLFNGKAHLRALDVWRQYPDPHILGFLQIIDELVLLAL